MADEQAQADATAQESTIETATGSEAVQNAAEEEKGRGDLSVALREERAKRQELEARLNDPEFIYEQAKKHGMTEAEAQAQAEAVEENAPQAGTYAAYKYYSELEKSQEKYPQLKGDREDQLAVTALMNGLKLSPLEAADRYYGKLAKKEEAKKEEEQEKAEEAAQTKKQAQAVHTTTASTADSIEFEDSLKRSRDFRNPREAEKAMLERLAWKRQHPNS